jgi:ribosomal protein S18 acetylase RimI-like enzyme
MDTVIQRSVVAHLSRRPEVVEVGPFVIGWDPSTDHRSFTYATPLLDAAITPADVAALVTAFRRIDRVPRLEYVISCAPELERHLLDAGFSVEERYDYLVCTPGSLTAPAVPDGFVLAVPATDEERAGMVAAQNEAFGGAPEATPADLARVRRTQDNGGVMLMVRAADGGYVGGGQAAAPGAGASEVAGIAVRERFRRRGIAGALTAALTGRAFAAGAQVAWLEAGGAEAGRVYERVGYVPGGKRLYIALD